MTSFLERFKGKTATIGKEGVTSIIQSTDKPIPKINSSDQRLQTNEGTYNYDANRSELKW